MGDTCPTCGQTDWGGRIVKLPHPSTDESTYAVACGRCGTVYTSESAREQIEGDGGFLDDADGPDVWRSARKRPVEVEFRGPYTDPDEIETIEGDFEVDEEYLDEHGGYVIIRGVQDEVYPCALDVFRRTYEPVYTGEVDDG